MKDEAAYESLVSRWRQAALLATSSALLDWDQQTSLPAAGTQYRGQQLALLAGLRHDRIVDPMVGELLSQLEASPLVADKDSTVAVNVREIRRAYDKETKLPKSLVEEIARTTPQAQYEWTQARKGKDFPHFLPWLTRVFDLTRQKARALAPNAPLYDTLLDDYETGATSHDLDTIFRGLREELVPLVRNILGSGRQPDESILKRNYPTDRQQMFGEMAAAEMGFDFSRGRLDSTTHPFCTTLGPHDCRILTRYNPRHFSEAFFGTLHEAGHGMYEQGLDPEQFGLPMGEAVSLGMHESQSRLWENAVGRSHAFWRFYYPRARAFFRDALTSVAMDDFHFAINKVAPSFIRVEADEVTYNLHILIRLELERAILNEDLSVEGLPAAWNEKYQQYLGILPPDDAQGCLQDVHWSVGLIGYFPTYTLGNIYGAQLFQQADQDLGGLDDLIGKGRFLDLLAWLRDKVHRHGKHYSPADLVRRATGSPPNGDILVSSLKSKFGRIYRVGG